MILINLAILGTVGLTTFGLALAGKALKHCDDFDPRPHEFQTARRNLASAILRLAATLIVGVPLVGIIWLGFVQHDVHEIPWWLSVPFSIALVSAFCNTASIVWNLIRAANSLREYR